MGFNLGAVLENDGRLPVRVDVYALAKGVEGGGVEFACGISVGEGAPVAGELGFNLVAPRFGKNSVFQRTSLGWRFFQAIPTMVPC